MNDDKEIIEMFSGLSVLDLADAKGSFCSKLLGDMGARVIKIERPCGFTERTYSSLSKDQSTPNNIYQFLYHNNNKLGITLNIENAEGRSIFLKLIKKSDVIIETFPVGYLERNRLDFNRLKSDNPKLIMASISGFGQDGPRKEYLSCDIVSSAFGGHMSVSGSPSKGPLKLFGDQSYYSSSLFAAIGIIIPLRSRRKTGRGVHLDISLQESVAATLDHVMPNYFAEGIIAKSQGATSWNSMFSILPCKDGFIQISLFYQWETLIELLDNEGMSEGLTNKKWLDEDYRRENIGHVIEILSRWSVNHPVQELFTLGQLMHFPWAPVQQVSDTIDCPQLKGRNFFIPVQHSVINKTIQHPVTPFRIEGMKTVPQRGAPTRGRDNFRIYHDELGIPKEELDSLSKDNVI